MWIVSVSLFCASFLRCGLAAVIYRLNCFMSSLFSERCRNAAARARDGDRRKRAWRDSACKCIVPWERLLLAEMVPKCDASDGRREASGRAGVLRGPCALATVRQSSRSTFGVCLRQDCLLVVTLPAKRCHQANSHCGPGSVRRENGPCRFALN
jgi:hypothetical protein